MIQGVSDNFLDLKLVTANHFNSFLQLRTQAGPLCLRPPAMQQETLVFCPEVQHDKTIASSF